MVPKLLKGVEIMPRCKVSSLEICGKHRQHRLTSLCLAHAEMHMLLATLFRRYDFEIYETDESDVRIEHDFFLPSPRLDSKGVRVKVRVVQS